MFMHVCVYSQNTLYILKDIKMKEITHARVLKTQVTFSF